MKELATIDTAEIKISKVEAFVEIKPENGTDFQEARDYLKQEFSGKNVEMNKREFGGRYTSFDDRLRYVPKKGENGYFEGKRGDSKFVPLDATERGKACKEKLAEYGTDGIQYHNGEADFSNVSESTVRIENMTENRADYWEDGEWKPGNFSQADVKAAEQWNAQGRDGRTDWTAKDVYSFRKNPEKKLTWHECCDTKTMQLVPYEVHSFCGHSGGVAECKARDAKNNGGEFDE